LTVTGLPITAAPFRTVNVAVPSLTTPAGLVNVAFNGTDWIPALNDTDALAAAAAAAAALTTSVLLRSVNGRKLAVPL